MRSNTADTAPQSHPLVTVGFCVDRAGEAAIQSAGVERIWMRGRCGESIDWLVDYLREKPAVMMVADDLRIFGPERKNISARLADFSRRNITLRDVRYADLNAHELMEKTQSSINAASGMKNRRRARYIGAKGGTAKGVAAWRTRNEIAPEWLIRNLVAEFGAKRTAALLENKISASSLDRHYHI